MPYCDCGNFSRDVVNGGPCSSCERQQRKEWDRAAKDQEKRQKALSAPKIKRTAIKKQGNNNTFLCSDGSRVTQGRIDELLRRHYSLYKRLSVCEGCRRAATSHAHIIPQARCKAIGKTELIWNRDNWFYGCFECNAAIENPKGQEWKDLLNIEKCLEFIKVHDKELYAKFITNR